MLENFSDFVRNRTFKFEVFAYREDRWVVESVIPNKEDAIIYAQSLMNKEGNYAVKVVQHRSMPDGFTTEREIYNESTTLTGEKPIKLQANLDDVPLCDQITDFVEFETRFLIGRLFKEFLFKFQITTTELLHMWPYIKKLEETGTLLPTAIYRIAEIQCAKHDIDINKRQKDIRVLVKQHKSLALETHSERRLLPAFKDDDLDYTFRRIRSKVGEDLAKFAMRFLMSQEFMDMNGLILKLERLCGYVEPGINPYIRRIVDQMIADTLIFSDIIMELFGRQPNRGVFLIQLGNLLNKREVNAIASANQTLMTLAELIKGDLIDDARSVLMHWLHRELQKDTALAKCKPEDEQKILNEMIASLTTDGGDLLGGYQTELAISKCKLRQRQRVMRAMGMDDVASTLEKNWQYPAPPPETSGIAAPIQQRA